MTLPNVARMAAALAVLGACAQNPAPGGAAATSPDGALRWTGSLKPTTQRKGDLGMADQARAFGTVTLLRPADSPDRTDVRLTLSAPGAAAGNLLPWAMLPGRCGSGAVPLMSLEQFGQVDVASNGRADFKINLALTLPESGTYHVNVYWPRGSQLSDVMTCANLTRS